METSLTLFEALANYVAVAAELAATVLIAIGIIDTGVRIVGDVLRGKATMRSLKDVWLRLAGYILLALEFALAADVVRTSISPNWEDVGKLAAIAVIRTVLSIFLERDLSSFERENFAAGGGETAPAQAPSGHKSQGFT